jgi:hypothetical protein
MSLRVQLFALLAFGLCAAILFCGGTASFAQNSDDRLELHANSHASAADIGLPAYPGATFYKDTNNDSAVDLGLNLGDFPFHFEGCQLREQRLTGTDFGVLSQTALTLWRSSRV